MHGYTYRVSINRQKNIIIAGIFLFVISGFVFLLDTFFNLSLFTHTLSSFVTIQTSVIALIVFALLNFLFIVNFLHTSHVEHNAVLKNVAEGLIVIGKNKKITVINEAAEKLLGLSSREAIGKTWEEIAQIESHKESVSLGNQPLFTSLSENRKIYSKEWNIRGIKGVAFPASLSISPMVSRGKVIGGIIVFRNIEKEKEIDNAKNEFISLVSHQLRTPLSAVNWCTESLLAGDRGKINNKQKEYIERISESNKRMISLVNSILDVSRIELNTFIVDAQPSDIFILIEDVVNESRHLVEAKELTLHKNYDKSLGIINIDARYVRMIIDNLLSNAIKYTPEKGRITLAVSRTDEVLSITISDTGYGIPETDASKIFTKLFRAHNILTKDTDGNGLGLYIVKSIVSYAGGKIWFESKENKGTTFFVTLPINNIPKEMGR